MWTPLHSQLHTTLRQRNLLPKGQRILMAISGGQDSVCLGKLLLDLQSKWGWKIAIGHCDHRWSYDEGIADHVEKLAQNWGIPFYLKVANNLKETEAAARDWRYQSLIEIAQENDFTEVVTGHTQSDRAETLLYNLIRGAGTDGLSSLTWQRNLTPNITLVRPLLNISRPETLAFCQQFDLSIWEDAANKNLKYSRNRIRQQLIPYLQTQFNPQVETNLAQTAEVLRAEVEYLETSAKMVLEQAINEDQTQLNRLILQSVPLALQRRVMRKFLQKISQREPNFEQIEALTQLIDAPRRSRTSSLPGNFSAEVQGDWIILSGMIKATQ
ncbi:tRNA(Ile)-lysidine synthetase [Rippkaea orientalis PCC 8801]|uniref:tRNA(Ile)-lysidine synthase n=1 Tax=Rippkaea orientalis (strain PCC 8801 / RF-1) TaxID=41431 RepID=B7K1Y2_RIPO1|nr:tRNA lysidine(34) synthetase TilS [Rippkaea orientalis]ACK64289.1 tRNA(Ile)-lysidine synthetase [Rippkaea orientalis PCC 8801]